MKQFIHIFIFIITIGSIAQEKTSKFYNEHGEKISQNDFLETKDYSKNIDVYYENDSLQIGVLLTRKKFGYFEPETFTKIKSYLTELSGKTIDSTHNIVINYLSGYFLNNEKDESKTRSRWNVLDKNYLKKLHNITEIEQFWVNSPKVKSNLKYYYSNRYDWLTDQDDFFKKLLFPHDVLLGNFILIKPNGRYYYYLGEHSKNKILKTSEQFFD